MGGGDQCATVALVTMRHMWPVVSLDSRHIKIMELWVPTEQGEKTTTIWVMHVYVYCVHC